MKAMKLVLLVGMLAVVTCLIIGDRPEVANAQDRSFDTIVGKLKDPIEGFDAGLYTEEWIDDAGDQDTNDYDFFVPPSGYDHFHRVEIHMRCPPGEASQVCSLRIFKTATDSTSFALDGTTAGAGTKCTPLHADSLGGVVRFVFDLKTPKVSLKAISAGDNITAFAYYK